MGNKTNIGNEARPYQQLKAIISEIMEQDQKRCGGRGFPTFDFSRGVLESKEYLGDFKLWFWFGKLLIVKPGQTKAKDMVELDDWNTELDGTITLLGGN